MRRRNIDDNASLDLLLDTICNTFGGVLFISMLVVILLSTSPATSTTLSPPDAETEADLIEWNKKLVDARREMTTLRAALAAQREMAQTVLDPNIRELLEERRKLQMQRTDHEDEKLQFIGDVSRAQVEVNRIARLMEEMTLAMQEAEENLKQANAKLKREIDLRTRSAKLPRAHRTKKQRVVMLLNEGRLTSYHLQQPDGSLVANPLEVEEVKDDGGLFIRPRKGAGVVVDPAAPAKTDKKFQAFNAKKYFVTIIVWPNSFASFSVVKDAMVRAGFKYELIPFPENAKVYFGKGSGESRVQ